MIIIIHKNIKIKINLIVLDKKENIKLMIMNMKI